MNWDANDGSPVPPMSDLSREELHRKFAGYIEEATEEAKAGSHNAAMLAVMQALATAAEGMERDDSPSAQLSRRKVALEEACEWDALLVLHMESIRHAETDGPKEISNPPPHYAPAMAGRAWEDLAGLQLLLGRNQQAWESAKTAIRYARQADMSPMIVTALRTEAHCLIKLGDWNQASEQAEESVHICDPKLPFVGPQIARSRMLLARCLAELGKAESARRELDLASALLGQPMFHPEILRAEWREAEAGVLLREGNAAAAIEALQAAVQLRRVGEATLMCGHANAAVRLATTLNQLAELLGEAGDATAAEKARREAAECRARFKLPASV